MKSKIARLLGVVVAVSMLASLLVGITAAPASAATNSMVFTPQLMPSNLNNFLGGQSCTNGVGSVSNPTGNLPSGQNPATFYTYRPNGNVHVSYLVATADGKTLYAWDDAAKMLYESMDSGKTWPNFVYINTATAVVGMAISPKFATDGTVVLADATEVWYVNTGVTNTNNVTGNLSTQLEGGTITSIDAGYYFSTNALTFLISVKGGAGAISNVLMFQVGGFTWSEVGDMKASGALAITGGALVGGGVATGTVTGASVTGSPVSLATNPQTITVGAPVLAVASTATGTATTPAMPTITVTGGTVISGGTFTLTSPVQTLTALTTGTFTVTMPAGIAGSITQTGTTVITGGTVALPAATTTTITVTTTGATPTMTITTPGQVVTIGIPAGSNVVSSVGTVTAGAGVLTAATQTVTVGMPVVTVAGASIPATPVTLTAPSQVITTTAATSFTVTMPAGIAGSAAGAGLTTNPTPLPAGATTTVPQTAAGAVTFTLTTALAFNVTMPAGIAGTATSGTATLPAPVTLNAGATTLVTLNVNSVGTVNIVLTTPLTFIVTTPAGIAGTAASAGATVAAGGALAAGVANTVTLAAGSSGTVTIIPTTALTFTVALNGTITGTATSGTAVVTSGTLTAGTSTVTLAPGSVGTVVITTSASGTLFDPQVVKVVFSVNHQSDAEIMAIYTDGTHTWLASIIGTLDWNNAILPKLQLDQYITASLATGATITTGPDYIGNTGSMILVGTQGWGVNDGVYRITNRASQGGTVSNPAVYITGSQDVFSVAVSGSLTAATTTVVVSLKNQINTTSMVWETGAINSSTITWNNPMAYKGPTPNNTTTTANVNTTLIFVNSGKTLLAGTTGNDSAVSVSTDAGNTFNQIGLIDVAGLGTGAYGTIIAPAGAVTGFTITSGGLNYANNVNATTGNVAVTILGNGDGLATNGNATVVTATGAITSIAPGTGGSGYTTGQPFIVTNVSNPQITVVSPTLWFARISVKSRGTGFYKSIDAGKSWMRILTWTGSITQARSPAFTTDNTFFITNKSTLALETTDGGATFSPVGAPVSINTASAIENGAFYLGGTSAAQFYLSGRWTNATWAPSTPAGYINSISRAPAVKDKNLLTIAVGTSIGTVYLSTDGGVTFNQVGTSGPGGPNDKIQVTWDSKGNLWATPTGSTTSPGDALITVNTNVASSVGGIWQWIASTSNWMNIDTTVTNGQTAVGIFSQSGSGPTITADGTMYTVGDWTSGANASSGNGVFRSLNYSATNADGTTAAIWQQINGTNFATGGTNVPSIGTTYTGYPTTVTTTIAAVPAGLTNIQLNTATPPVAVNTGIAGTRSSASVVAAATVNTIYITEASNMVVNSNETGGIYTFGDSFIVGPTVTTPKDGTLLTTSNSATMSWTALNGPGAGDTPVNTNYLVQVTTSKDFTGTTTPILGPANNGVIFTTATTGIPAAQLAKIDTAPAGGTAYTSGLDNYTAGNTTQTVGVNPPVHNPPLSTDIQLVGGTLYYWQVQAVSPLLSRATVVSYTTALQQVVNPTATNTLPSLGSTGVDVNPTFSWPTITGSLGYEFVLAEDLGNKTDHFAIIDYSATTDVPAITAKETLKYSTTYYWEVRAYNATTKGPWAVSFFTTMAKPTTSATTGGGGGGGVVTVTPTTITFTTNPPAVVTLTVPTSTTPIQVIPNYLLWAIIGVGAVLVIAVIVLIVRTRRMS